MHSVTISKSGERNRFVPAAFNETDSLAKNRGDNFFLCLLKEGMADVTIDETEYMLNSPVLICLNDEQVLTPLKTHHISAESILFEPTFINRNMTKEAVRSHQYAALADIHDYFLMEPFLNSKGIYSHFIRITPDVLERTDALFHACGLELETQSDWYWSCRARSYFIELMHVLERLYFNANKNAANQKFNFRIPVGYEDIGEVLLFLNTHYQDELSLDDISGRIHTSRASLNRRFKKITGFTVFDYLTEYRLYIAASLLRFTDLSIEEISGRVGFRYANNFIPVFKSKYGMPPNKFRKSAIERRKMNNCG